MGVVEETIPVAMSAAGMSYYEEHGWDDLIAASIDFRSFLNHWHFVDQETQQDRVLGEVLWEAQEEFVRVTSRAKWIFFLKARKLGETTIECAYDGWVARFRDPMARVHLFSRRDDAAQELLNAVKYGLRRLPEPMRLPEEKNTTHELHLTAGDAVKIVKAYPADEETAVEATCTHGHVDEWARMRNPRKVWQAIEPSMAGTCHFVTTGLGPNNWTSQFWRRCIAGDVISKHSTPIYACFIGALARPDRTQAWLRAKRTSSGDLQHFLQEYPMKWEDALSGGGDFVFTSDEITQAGIDARGLGPPASGRKYITAWDIGRHQDAAVGVVLDVTEDVHDVVCYRRLREHPYPMIQREIEMVAAAYPGMVVIEKNAAGEAVMENLNLPSYRLEGFSTTKASKARIISGLKLQLQHWCLKWDSEACPELTAEMRGYQQPDDDIVQDSVITLAIAEDHAELAHKAGRIMGITQV